MEAVKSRKRIDRACLGGVCCRRRPEPAGSEWAEPPGCPGHSETKTGTRGQAPQRWGGAWLQRHWRPLQRGEWVETLSPASLMSRKGRRGGQTDGCRRPRRQNGTSWLWSWRWDSCRSEEPEERRRRGRRASSPRGEGVPAGGALWRRGLASGGWTPMMGRVWERRGGWRDAGEGGASLWLRDSSSGNHLRTDGADPGFSRSADQASLDWLTALDPPLLPVLVGRLWTD